MIEVEENRECPVCFENLRRTVQAVPPCSHAICMRCLLRLRPPLACPLCRMDLSAFVSTPPAAHGAAVHPSSTLLLGGAHVDFALPPPDGRLTARSSAVILDLTSDDEVPAEDATHSSVIAALRTRPRPPRSTTV